MVGEPCPEEDWKFFIDKVPFFSSCPVFTQPKVDFDKSGTIEFEEFLFALYLWFGGAEEVEISFQE